VAKVTILPAGMALGVTEQLPEAEHRLHQESYLYDSLAVRLGGRAAEIIVFGESSTGAANDLAGATDLAMRMVRDWGMSPKLGPISFSGDQRDYLGGQEARPRPYAEETQRLIDEEVSRLLRDAELRATELLSSHRHTLDQLVELLLQKEVLDGKVVYELADRRHADRPSVGEAPDAGPSKVGVAPADPGTGGDLGSKVGTLR
jgi:cell division protease FtsH